MSKWVRQQLSIHVHGVVADTYFKRDLLYAELPTTQNYHHFVSRMSQNESRSRLAAEPPNSIAVHCTEYVHGSMEGKNSKSHSAHPGLSLHRETPAIKT